MLKEFESQHNSARLLLNKSKPPLITFSTTVEAETNKESFVILVYDSVNLYLALVVHSLC